MPSTEPLEGADSISLVNSRARQCALEQAPPADQAGQQALEAFEHLAASKLTTQVSVAPGVNAVQLKNSFLLISPKFGNDVHGW